MFTTKRSCYANTKNYFWVFLFIIFYAYIGYGILLFFLVRIKRMLGWSKTGIADPDYEPEVTLFVAAYNEKD